MEMKVPPEVVVTPVEAPAAVPPGATPPAAATPSPAPAAPAAPAPGAPPAAPGATPPAAAATPPAVKPAATIADPPAEPPPVAMPATWPEKWREEMAGDDKKLLARLERMQSPKDILNSWRAMEQRLSSGELKRALPNNATPEEVAEYRKSWGIPDKPEGYDITLPNGFVWGEADKPLLQDYTGFALERNLPQDVVKANLEWVVRMQDKMQEQIAQRDENERITGSEALRAEWGKDFKANLTAAKNLFPDENTWNLLMGSRAEDGVKIGNKPEVLKLLAGISREVNPFATLVPDNTAAPAKSAEARMAELNGMMRDKSGPYWRGAQANALQQEWRDLFNALEKSKGQGRAA
jgi:hypothetical protein